MCIQLVFRDECSSKAHRNLRRTDGVVLIETRCRARQLVASRVGQAVVAHVDVLPTCEHIGLRERISGSSASVHLSPPLITPRRDHRLVIIPAVDALGFTFEFSTGLVRTSTLGLTLEVDTGIDIDEDVDIGVGLGGRVLSIHGATEPTLSRDCGWRVGARVCVRVCIEVEPPTNRRGFHSVVETADLLCGEANRRRESVVCRL